MKLSWIARKIPNGSKASAPPNIIRSRQQDRQEIEFFGKFVLRRNNEDNFIQIDPGEIRYWIRRLPPLQQDNKGLLAELRGEIPFFIHYLVERPFTT